MSGYGASFQRSNDSGENYVQVAGLYSIDEMPESTLSTYDDTRLDNPDKNHHMVFGGGLIDPGELAITLSFSASETQQGLLLNDHHNRTLGYYRIVYPGGESLTFRALVTGVGSAIPREDKITRAVKFKVSGQAVEASG